MMSMLGARSRSVISTAARGCSKRYDWKNVMGGRGVVVEQQQCCWLSTNTNKERKSKQSQAQLYNGGNNNNNGFEPGEWDPTMESNDPTYRPPWKNRANIMSAEDFAMRPKAGFNEEFSSMHDAMVVLSWLKQEDKDKMYEMYLELMLAMADRQDNTNSNTSHEYVVRVVAQRFNISPIRAAAVISQCHDEERLKAAGEDLHNDAQEYADAKIQQHIDAAYSAYREVNPNSNSVVFVEDPIGAAIEPASVAAEKQIVSNDLLVVQQLAKDAQLRNLEQAQIAISNRVYAQDVDPSQTPVPITNMDECNTLLQRKNHDFVPLSQPPPYYYPNNNNNNEEQANRRPRWKFVAKTINVKRDKKRMNNNNNNKSNNRKKQQQRIQIENTLVEHDGVLRVATVQEASNTALKSKRNVMDFTLANVKQAWIDRQVHGKVGGWGRAPPDTKNKKQVNPKPTKQDNDADAAVMESNETKTNDE